MFLWFLFEIFTLFYILVNNHLISTLSLNPCFYLRDSTQSAINSNWLVLNLCGSPPEFFFQLQFLIGARRVFEMFSVMIKLFVLLVGFFFRCQLKKIYYLAEIQSVKTQQIRKFNMYWQIMRLSLMTLMIKKYLFVLRLDFASWHFQHTLKMPMINTEWICFSLNC